MLRRLHLPMWVGRFSLLGGFLAILVLLPVALEMTTTLDMIHGAIPFRPSGAVELSEAVDVVPAVGLRLERGLVTRAPEPFMSFGRQKSVVFVDRAIITLDAGLAAPMSRPPPGAAAAKMARVEGIDAETIVLRHGEVRIARPGAAPITLTGVTAEFSGNGKGGGKLNGLATYNNHRFEISMQWSPQPMTAGLEARVPMTLHIGARMMQIGFDGYIGWTAGKPRIEGETSMRARKLRSFARWLGYPVGWSRDLRDFAATGRMELADGVLSFARADVRIDGNEGSGALTIKTTGARPSIEGTIGFDKLSLQPYVVSLLDETPRPEPAERQQKTTSLLNIVDADLRLSASKVVAPNLETGRGAVTITLKDGRLQADLAELEIEGGRAVGQLKIDMNGEQAKLGIKARLQDIDPGRAFTDALKRNPLQGRAVVTLEAVGSGTSMPQILSRLNGKGSFALRDGGRLGLDLRTLAYVAHSSQIVGWAAAGKGTTYFEQLDGRFSLSNGGFVIEALNGRTGQVLYAGAGKIDVPARLIDFALSLGTSTADGQPVREQLAFRGGWQDPAISFLRIPLAPPGSIGATSPVATGAVRH